MQRATAEELLCRLRYYGLFIVPVGELEQWLADDKNIPRTKGKFLEAAFDIIGRNAGDQPYLTDGDKDVWQFMTHVLAWTSDPGRKGMERFTTTD